MPQALFDPLPAAAREQLAAAIGGPPLSAGYLRFLVDELKPRIDRAFATDPAREATFITGSSMGGLISLDALTAYPRVFAGAGCLSTHWPLPAFAADRPAIDAGAAMAAAEAWLGGALPPPGRHRLWFDHGDQQLDRVYAPYQARVDALLRARGWRAGRDVVSRAYPGTGHDEIAWRTRLADPLGFLLKA